MLDLGHCLDFKELETSIHWLADAWCFVIPVPGLLPEKRSKCPSEGEGIAQW